MSMTNEQEKALYRLNVHSKYATSNGEVVVNKSDIDAVLSLIKEQDKIIDLMAEYIAGLDIDEDICKEQAELRL